MLGSLSAMLGSLSAMLGSLSAMLGSLIAVPVSSPAHAWFFNCLRRFSRHVSFFIY
jgi:hypothetical protein